jgi:hypothetical protein
MKIRTELKSGAFWYKVQDGDTLEKIAISAYGPNILPEDVVRIYSTNMTTIGTDPCTLKTGASLFIPSQPTPQPAPVPNPPNPPVPVPPTPDPQPMPGECQEFWGNGVCLYKTCPYPPFTMDC